MYSNSREHSQPAKRGLSRAADSLPLARRRYSKAAYSSRLTVSSTPIANTTTTADLEGWTTHRCRDTPYWDPAGDSSPQGTLGHMCGGAFALRYVAEDGLSSRLWIVVRWDGTEDLTMHDLLAFEASNPGITDELLEQLPSELVTAVRAVLPAQQPTTGIMRLLQEIPLGPVASPGNIAEPGPSSSAGPGPTRGHHMSLFSADSSPRLYSPSTSDMDTLRVIHGGRGSFGRDSRHWPEPAAAGQNPSGAPVPAAVPVATTGLQADPFPGFEDLRVYLAWAERNGSRSG